jgi:hypothetical protein
MGAEVGAPLVDRTSTLLPNSVATKATISSMEVGKLYVLQARQGSHTGKLQLP